MVRVDVDEVQAWVEDSKLRVESLESPMLTQLEAQILGQLGAVFDTSTWVDGATTPELVRSVITIKYASWLYNKTYSEDQENLNDYALWLSGQADLLLAGIIGGTIVIPDVTLPTTGNPSFYPNDASSALEPTCFDRSLGDAKFSMGGRF